MELISDNEHTKSIYQTINSKKFVGLSKKPAVPKNNNETNDNDVSCAPSLRRNKKVDWNWILFQIIIIANCDTFSER